LKDPQKILIYPEATEKAVRLIETENKLTFIAAPEASRIDVKKAAEILFEVKVKSVKTEMLPDGRKRAYIKLAEGFNADDVASKLGMI
jgi:large subunit ribosomal protein L23